MTDKLSYQGLVLAMFAFGKQAQGIFTKFSHTMVCTISLLVFLTQYPLGDVMQAVSVGYNIFILSIVCSLSL